MTLERDILETLADCVAGDRVYALPLKALQGSVEMKRQPEAVTKADFDRALSRLQAKGQIAGTSHEDHGTMWKITAEGRLRLAE